MTHQRSFKVALTQIARTTLLIAGMAWVSPPNVFSQECSNPGPFFEHLRVSIMRAASRPRQRALLDRIEQAERAYAEGVPEIAAGALDDIADSVIQELPRVPDFGRPLLLSVLDSEALLTDALGLGPFVARHWVRYRDRQCDPGTGPCTIESEGSICYEISPGVCASSTPIVP